MTILEWSLNQVRFLLFLLYTCEISKALIWWLTLTSVQLLYFLFSIYLIIECIYNCLNKTDYEMCLNQLSIQWRQSFWMLTVPLPNISTVYYSVIGQLSYQGEISVLGLLMKRPPELNTHNIKSMVSQLSEKMKLSINAINVNYHC